jgi:glutamate-ammonia-ligase adenylyltransferase
LEAPFDPSTAPSGLKALLARAGDAPDFPILERHVRNTLEDVSQLFSELIV